MNRRGLLRKIPVLLACFLGGKVGRELDNCGVKVIRREDGGIMVDGSNCKLETPKDGWVETDDRQQGAVTFRKFTIT